MTQLAEAAVAAPATAPPRRRAEPPSWGLGAAALAVGLLFAAPLAYLVIRNVTTGADVQGVWLQSDTWAPLVRSILLAGSVTVAAATLGTGLAWLVARTDLPARRGFGVLLLLPLVIPSFIGAFAFVAGFARGGLVARMVAPLGVTSLPQVRGFWAALVILTLFTYPYVLLPVAARLRALPASLEESARLLGHRPASVFALVVLPQIRTSIFAGGLLVLLYTLSDFGAVSLLRYDTLTRAIYATRLYDRPTSLAMSLLLGLLAVVVVALERKVARAHAPVRERTTATTLRVPLGRWRVPALCAAGGTVAAGLAAPVAVLLFWVWQGLRHQPSFSRALWAELGTLAGPAVNTGRVAVLAAAAAVVALLPVAYATVRRRGWTGATANALIVGGFALPGLVGALALTFWVLQMPEAIGDRLYQSQMLLVFAYVTHFGAQSLRANQVAVAGIPSAVEDAARTLGANRLRRFWQLELPLMRPGLLAGGGLVLLSTAKELPATLLLAPPGFRTLATRVWNATEDALMAQASIAALALIAVSGLLTWLLIVRSSDVAGRR